MGPIIFVKLREENQIRIFQTKHCFCVLFFLKKENVVFVLVRVSCENFKKYVEIT